MRRNFPIAFVAASGLLAASAGGLAAQAEDAPEPPVEFTACVEPGPAVSEFDDERIEVSVPDGEMTIVRERQHTFRLAVSEVSDPRLDGTWYTSVDVDSYTMPGGSPGPTFGATSYRIENDEGAWQGSRVSLGFPTARVSMGRSC